MLGRRRARKLLSVTVCLMILNYNGRRHLQDCLPSALAASGKVKTRCPVVVVDNQSVEDDVEFIRSEFPAVEVVVAKKNDTLFSLNKVVSARSEDIVVILNNDMRFDEDFIEPLLGHFTKPDVFAVSAKMFNWEGTESTMGRKIGALRNFWFYKYSQHSVEKACLTLDAGGGCSAFRRSMFAELRGFDSLFRPAYWEDTDLSYRAWKRGWQIVYEPRSIIYHKIGATLDALYGRSKMTRLIARNGVLFTVKNCGGIYFILSYLFLLPLRAITNYCKGNTSLTLGIIDALPKIPLALKRRFEEFRFCRVKDDDFLARIMADQ